MQGCKGSPYPTLQNAGDPTHREIVRYDAWLGILAEPTYETEVSVTYREAEAATRYRLVNPGAVSFWRLVPTFCNELPEMLMTRRRRASSMAHGRLAQVTEPGYQALLQLGAG